MGSQYTVGNGDNGFVYSDGTFSPLDLPGSTSTDLRGISNNGQIVGIASGGQSCGTSCAFLYSGGNFTILHVPGSSYTSASGVNNQGMVVGSYQDASNQSHGYIYFDGKYTTFDIPTLVAAGTQTGLSGINDSGQISGDYLPLPEPSTLLLLSGACSAVVLRLRRVF